MAYKYGLKPVQEQPRIQLVNYLTSDLPAAASLKYPFGHASLVNPNWGMAMNNVLGCCAIAGSAHETMLLTREGAGPAATFSDRTIVNNYSAITGYRVGREIEGFNPDGSAIINPAALDGDLPPNPTDQGTDVHQLFAYRKKVGLVDDAGVRHKVVGYAGLRVGDFDELLVALSLFTTVAIGINCPDFLQAQFQAGGPWDVEAGDPDPDIEGGHYIPAVLGDSPDLVDIVTWGGQIGLTRAFYETFSTVAVVALSNDMFKDGVDIDGVDLQKLAHDLPEFNTGPVEEAA